MASAQPAVRIDSLEKRYASGTLALKGCLLYTSDAADEL